MRFQRPSGSEQGRIAAGTRFKDAAVGLWFISFLAISPIVLLSGGGALGSSVGTSHSCVDVPNGSVVNPVSGEILLSNASIIKIGSFPCADAVQASTNGTAAYAYSYLSSTSYYFTSMNSTWTVPAAPSSGSFSFGSDVFLWNGFNTATGTKDVAQPVLAYGCVQWSGNTCTNGSSSGWSIDDQANVGNTQYFSGGTSVSVGDSITGEVTYDSSESFCLFSGPAYSIEVGDYTTGHYTVYEICDTYKFQAAVGEAFEVHELTSCTQNPNVSSESFELWAEGWSGGSNTFTYGSPVSWCSASASWNAGDYLATATWTT
jgi:hypothetical protein